MPGDNILRRDRAQRILLTHGGALFQHLPDALGGEGGFFIIGVAVGDFQNVQLRGPVPQRNVGHALPQCFRFRIG